MEKTIMEQAHAEPVAVGSIDEVRALFSDDPVSRARRPTFVRGDTLIVRGWIAPALDVPTEGQQVEIAVDGSFAAVEGSIPRPDVAAAHGAPNLQHAGFVAVINTARLHAGEHAFTVSVRGDGFAAHPLPRRFAFTLVEDRALVPDVEESPPGRIAGFIETWSVIPRTARSGGGEVEVFVRGWACDLATGRPAADVFGIADRRHTARAVMGYMRPDVATKLGSPGFGPCGFRLRMLLPASIANDGSIEIVALASDRESRSRIVPTKSQPHLPSLAGIVPAPAGRLDMDDCEHQILHDVLEIERSRGKSDDGVSFDSQQGVDTESPVFFDRLLLERLGDVSHFEHYEASPTASFEEGLDAVPLAFETATFIDVGAGKGRTLMLAARRPFRAVTGVEINPSLVEIARENLMRIDRGAFRCHDVSIAEGDASHYVFPPGDLVVFLFNPFDATVLRPVVERLGKHAGDVAIVYQFPVQRRVIEASGRFEAVATFTNGIVYRRRPPA